ncbi:phosphatidylserine/phosphatidylglycerophosphate/cardiolipin synthase family protein [Jiella sp. M17.18]|uniref:phospholipase D-like domain-containing protein n=1 Tax=Jiella sp. M17.18 TaxID=3234247 RepID=UPI0034DFD9D0
MRAWRKAGTIIEDLSIAAASAEAQQVEGEPTWRMYHANETIWPAVLDLCASARETLDIEQYIFSHEGIGRDLLAILTERARAGVRVRLLADGYGSFGLPVSASGKALLDAGGTIVIYNRARRLLHNPIAGFHRLHRKSVLCDSRRMMVGGSCYADRMADWRDTMVLIEGTITNAAERAFETAWRYALGKQEPRDLPRANVDRIEAEHWSYLTSEPQRPTKQEIYQSLLKKLAAAHETIDLTSPYLAPDRKIWHALTRAVQRGVRVRLIIPSTSDHPVVDIVSQHFARRLAKRGIEVYGYDPAMIHAKIAIIDQWAMVSSFNLDMLSIGLNVENGLGSRSPAFREELAAQYECDVATSTRF